MKRTPEFKICWITHFTEISQNCHEKNKCPLKRKFQFTFFSCLTKFATIANERKKLSEISFWHRKSDYCIIHDRPIKMFLILSFACFCRNTTETSFTFHHFAPVALASMNKTDYNSLSCMHCLSLESMIQISWLFLATCDAFCDSQQRPSNVNWKLLCRFFISPMKIKFFLLRAE